MGFTLHLLLSSTNFYCLLPLLRIRTNREMKLYAAVYRTDMFCNEKYFSKIIFTWCDPVVAFIFHCMFKGFKSIKNNTSTLQQVFNWWELYICLLLQIKLYLEGKGAFGRRIKKKDSRQLTISMILSWEMDFQQDLLLQIQHCLVMPFHTILILNWGRVFDFS